MRKLIVMLVCLGSFNLASAVDSGLIPILIKPDGYKLLVSVYGAKSERLNDSEPFIVLVEDYPKVDKTPDKEYGDRVGNTLISGMYVRCDRNLFRLDNVIHVSPEDLKITEYEDTEFSEKIYKKPIPNSSIAIAIEWYCSRQL